MGHASGTQTRHRLGHRNHPSIQPVPGLEHRSVLDEQDTIATTTVPSSLIVLGRGAEISLELGQVFARFGSRARSSRSPSGWCRTNPKPAVPRRYYTKDGIDVPTGVNRHRYR